MPGPPKSQILRPFPGQPLLPGPAPPGYPQALPLPQPPPYLDPAAAYPEHLLPGQPLLPGPAPPGYPQALPLPQPPPYLDPAAAYPELYRLSVVPLGAAGVPAVSPPYPGPSLYVPLAPPLPPAALGSPVAYLPLGQVLPPGSTLLLEGGFDRLGTGGTASVPPPPPGCPPAAPPVPVPPGAAVLLPPRKGGFLGGAFSLCDSRLH
ncbi:DAZ-associated protein 2 [Passer montanus]|uniref:DAZ-associated protein 2 n=1 Tax=Passer montanus TaxID=9160 RepID=UPI00195FC80D|nr:DAZ-associated protein 2 [Passer montanus]